MTEAISTFTKFVLVGLVASIFIVGIFQVIGGMAGEDALNVTVDDTLTRYYGNLTDLDEVDDIREDLNNIRSDKESQFFTGTWDAIKKSLSLIADGFETTAVTVELASDAETGIGIPEEIKTFVITLLVLMAIAGVLFLLLKVK